MYQEESQPSQSPEKVLYTTEEGLNITNMSQIHQKVPQMEQDASEAG